MTAPADLHDPASEEYDPRRLMMPGEVAKLFRVDPRTVSRWERQGRLACVRTLGGYRRFYTDQVEDLIGMPRGTL